MTSPMRAFQRSQQQRGPERAQTDRPEERAARDERDAQLEALYAKLPTLNCQGRGCHISCGPITASVRERERTEEAGGRRLAADEQLVCTMLTGSKRCSVHPVRPMICRLWGMVESMRCPFGCVPEPRYLTDLEAIRFLAAAEEASGICLGNSRFVAMARQLETEGDARRLMSWS